MERSRSGVSLGFAEMTSARLSLVQRASYPGDLHPKTILATETRYQCPPWWRPTDGHRHCLAFRVQRRHLQTSPNAVRNQRNGGSPRPPTGVDEAGDSRSGQAVTGTSSAPVPPLARTHRRP